MPKVTLRHKDEMEEGTAKLQESCRVSPSQSRRLQRWCPVCWNTFVILDRCVLLCWVSKRLLRTHVGPFVDERRIRG